LKGPVILKENHQIAVIYGFFLVIGVILCVGAVVFIPVDAYTANYKAKEIELVPSETTMPSRNVREFHFRNVDWVNNGTCLNFLSSHQEVKVEADGILIFERNAVETFWGRSTGFAWEYIEIPPETTEVIVTLTACYPAVRNIPMSFCQGISTKMYQDLFHQESFSLLISILNVCLGLFLLIYGGIMRKRTSVGEAMFYLGIFTVILGIWSLTENGIMAVLMSRRAASSFISFTSLALVGIPFIMFVHSYLQPADKYVYKTLLGLNVFNIVLVFSLQLFEICDMKQTLFLTHISLVTAFLYLPFCLVYMLRKHLLIRRFWVTVFSLLSLCPPLVYSLYMYYGSSKTVSNYGNVSIFLFVAIFAVDVYRSIMKDLEEGKKVALYKELATKDLLTDCYNRNAYRDDTNNCTDWTRVLLVTCDLNNLKQCNDTLGHACGDQYITDSAKILKKVFSPHGKIYRIGGDEFCIIIPDSRKCNIGILLAALKEEQRIYNAGSKVIRLQIACGYAEFDADTDTNIEDIRNRADIRMYQNKKELKDEQQASASPMNK
jgi:diguanylate cyclase (GGDEF)-like protein